MTLIEAAKLALEHGEFPQGSGIIRELRQAIAEAEIKHEVENANDWSKWVCPDPNGYLMKCCNCGLVHEAQFCVVRYKSENEREDCEKVDDPNLQAVFRMRRSEQWSPDDTAHRAGGLPMEQPEQQEPVAWMTITDCGDEDDIWYENPEGKLLEGWTHKPLYTTPPQRKPLTDEQIIEMYNEPRSDAEMLEFARAIEQAHGIKE